MILKGLAMADDQKDPLNGDSARDNQDEKDKSNTGNKPKEFLKRLS